MRIGRVKRPLSKMVVEIHYTAPRSSGILIVDSHFYEDNIKLFAAKMKDCEITQFEMRPRRKDDDIQ